MSIDFNVLIGAFALLLSVVNSWVLWYKSRRRLNFEQVGVKWIKKTVSAELLSIPVFSFYMSNPSKLPVHVRDIWLLPSGGPVFELFEHGDMYLGRPAHFTIEPLRRHLFLADTPQLMLGLRSRGHAGDVEVRIKVRDETGQSYTSKPYQLASGQLNVTPLPSTSSGAANL